jgi:hypothetical protein
VFSPPALALTVPFFPPTVVDLHMGINCGVVDLLHGQSPAHDFRSSTFHGTIKVLTVATLSITMAIFSTALATLHNKIISFSLWTNKNCPHQRTSPKPNIATILNVILARDVEGADHQSTYQFCALDILTSRGISDGDSLTSGC